MRTLRLALLLLVSGCSAPSTTDPIPERRATIRGMVLVDGQAPRRKPINLSDIPEHLRPAHLETERVVVDGENHLQWAFVYVTRAGTSPVLALTAAPIPMAPVTFHFEGLRLLPRCAGALVGQEVVVRNVDENLHTFHTQGNPAWPMPGLPPMASATFRLTRYEGVVPIRCDVHPWEYAWVGVFTHPYFAVTGPSGEYEIEGLAPGKYNLEVWHEYYESVSAEVSVASGQSLTQDFVVKRRKD